MNSFGGIDSDRLSIQRNPFGALLFVLATAAITLFLLNSTASAAKRVALVIGNSDYKNAASLKNPKNDAIDLSEKLVKLGFEVIGGFDLDKVTMKRKIRDFSRALSGADVSLFFYAGHAMQVNGKNYLAPIDTDISFEADLDFETIPMGLVQNQMERNTKTSLIFLDACRDNPLTRSMWSKSRTKGPQGLAESVQSAEGTLIAFSTQPGNVALDGDDRNSPFTTALLENIERPNVEISSLMTDVRMQVYSNTEEKQLPWSRSSLLGRFYFNGNGNENTVVASTEGIVAPTANVITQSQNDANNQNQIAIMTMQKMAWETIQDSNDAVMYEAFINKFKGSFFSELAKAKIAQLDKPKNIQTASLNDSTNQQNIVAPSTNTQPLATSRNTNFGNGTPNANTLRPEDIVYKIQVSLQNIGCSPGRPDGKWGRNSNRALDAFTRYSGMSIISYSPNMQLLDQMKKFELSDRNNGRVCPVRKVVTRRQPQRKVFGNGLNLNGAVGALIGGVIACKALGKC